MSLETLFSTSELSLVVPDTTLEFPPESSVDEWLGRVKIGKVERKLAFFDEQLQSLLLLRIQHPTPDNPADPNNPPVALLEFLNYLQVSLEASYISPVAPTTQEPSWNSRLSAPPRASSLGRPSPRLNVNTPQNPSIFPPATPNPVPSTGEQDRQYAGSEGAFLAGIIWGAVSSEESKDAFSLLWSEKEKLWVAVYRLHLTVSFLKTVNFANPLLCLTVATTLRDKPIITSDKHPLSKFLATLGINIPHSPAARNEGEQDKLDDLLLDGLEEINLLEGLLAAPDLAQVGGEKLNVPSSRLGSVSRQKLFSLPPYIAETPHAPSPSPMTAVRKAHPTLRKAYRRTLQTVSTFQLRMRTVFVPHVLLPDSERSSDETDLERERREAGSAERTVVLCVEIKNSGEQEVQHGIGFMVHGLDIKIGGEGAKTTLIGWGKDGLSAQAAKSTFPLKLGPYAQVNLLYAITFLRSPEELDTFSFAKPDAKGRSELRRGLSITVHGQPYTPLTPSARALLTEPDAITLPTKSFASVWSTVLDLDANPAPVLDSFDLTDPLGGLPTTLPEPASPFPLYALGSSKMATPTTGMFPYSAGTTPQSSVFAGSKRFPLTPGGYFQSQIAKNSGVRPASRPSSAIPPHMQSRTQSPSPGSGRLSASAYNSAPVQYMRSPTTYSAPTQQPPLPIPPPHSPGPSYFYSPSLDDGNFTATAANSNTDAIPPTPAYPAWPHKSTLPPSPMSMGPIASQSQPNVGPSVEIRRDRLSVGPGGPMTPVQHISAAFGEQRLFNKLQNSATSGENIVVSVGLLTSGEGGGSGGDKIYPLDAFTLDIFVFNQSTWTRRFEVTCPEKRRRRRGGVQSGVYGGGGEIARSMGYPGVLPMNKRVRIGPLRPSACQSVRMEFLAISPGVHSIDTLTLTDTETGFSMNLRAVLDVVIHDPHD